MRSKTSVARTKKELVCPRCKKQKENEDCLYDVYVEVKGIERSSHPGSVLEDFEYTVCGTCQTEIELYISERNKKGSGAKKAAPEPQSTQPQSSQGVNQNDRIRG